MLTRYLNNVSLPCFKISACTLFSSRGLTIFFIIILATMVILWKSKQSSYCFLAASHVCIKPWVMILVHPVVDSLKKADMIALLLLSKWQSFFGHILFLSSYSLWCANGQSKISYNGHCSSVSIFAIYPRKVQELQL